MHACKWRAAQADISLDHLHLRWGAGAVSNAIAPGRGSVKTGGRGSLGGKRGSVEAPADGLPHLARARHIEQSPLARQARFRSRSSSSQ